MHSQPSLFAATQFRWQYQSIDAQVVESILALQPILEKITRSGFGGSVSFDLKEVKKGLIYSSHVALLHDIVTGSIHGFAFYYVSKKPCLNGSYVFINNVCLSKTTQKSGSFSTLMRTIIEESTIAWLGARTQNSHVIKVLTKYGTLTYPLTITYNNESGAEVLAFTQEQIPQIKNSTATIDPISGICKCYYGQRLGDFPITSSVKKIEQLLTTFSFNRDDGDAALITVRLK